MNRCFLACLLLSTAPLCAQDVRIAEFLTANTNGLRDELGAFSPWIEIWNTNSAATGKQSLGGWKLVHGAVEWVIPTITLMPDEHYIIWASGRDRRVVTAPLHTNFVLNRNGSYLALKRPDGTIASEFSPQYPVQQDNISFGRDGANPALTGFYSTPSPGERNAYNGPAIAGKVAFSVPSKSFTGQLQVTLAPVVADPEARIRYTIDGSVPVETSFAYTGPIAVSTTQIVRARLFKTGALPGETESHGYLFLSANAAALTSVIPIIVLTNFRTDGVAPPADGDQSGFMWVFEPPPGGKAALTDPPTLATRIAMDRRGSSTLDNAKYNLNVEARRSRDDNDKDIALLAMPAEADWVFHAPFGYDPSLIHNPLAYGLSNSIGRYAMRTRMAEVFIETNGSSLSYAATGASDYFGVYNVMEKIRRGAERVDVAGLDVYDNDAVGKTGGYIVKVDRLDTPEGDQGFSVGGQRLAYYEPKEREIKAPQRAPQDAYLQGFFSSYTTALLGSSYRDPVIGYRKYLDLPAAIDHHLLNVWTFNVDALRLSGYMHKDRGGKLIYGPVWDFDRALSSTDGRDANPAVWRSQVSDKGTDFFNYTWWSRLFSDPDFYQQYIDRWVNLRRSQFSPAAVNGLIDALNAAIGPTATARDLARWGKAKRNWTSPFTGQTFTGQTGEIQRIKDWLQQRANFMDSQWVAPVTVTPAEGNVAVGTTVTLSGPTGATIYYTTNGSDPRPPGGGPPVSALIYREPITIDSTMRLRARAHNPSWTAATGPDNPPLISSWSGRTDARYSTDAIARAGNLVVSEVHYHPANPTATELGVNPRFVDADFEFIELKNIGATTVDFGGVKLAGDVEFTAVGDNAISIAPGGFAIVAANPQAFTARYGVKANLLGPYIRRLDNNSGLISLLAASGASIVGFTVDDNWYAPTDGGGYSLAVFDPIAPPAAFSTAANWRQSAAVGGSPGADEPNRAPVVLAGAEVLGFVSGVTLEAQVSDDRLPDPPRGLTFAWSSQSGPGAATFSNPTAAASSVTFSMPGVYVLRLVAHDGSLEAFDEVTVFARDTAAAWLDRHPGIGSLSDDFDGDGRTNYGEFALLSDPTKADASGTEGSSLVGGRLTLIYSRIKPPSGVNYVVEVGISATSWAPAAPGEVIEETLTDNGVVQKIRVTDTKAANDVPQRFMRVRVSPYP